VAQEAYSSDHGGAYYNGALPNPALIWEASQGVTITLSTVTATGWAATAPHGSITRTCSIFTGTSGPIGPATIEGRVACTPPSARSRRDRSGPPPLHRPTAGAAGLPGQRSRPARRAHHAAPGRRRSRDAHRPARRLLAGQHPGLRAVREPRDPPAGAG